MDRDRHEAGMRVRCEVLGVDYRARAVADATEFGSRSRRTSPRWASGEARMRGELDAWTLGRSWLSVLRYHEELVTTGHAVRCDGITADEVGEGLLYTGVPTVGGAWAIMLRTSAELGEAAASRTAG